MSKLSRPDATRRWIHTGEGSAMFMTLIGQSARRRRRDFVNLDMVEPQEGRVVNV